MQGKLIVIAIGGNSLIEDPKKVTVDAQYRAAEKTAHFIADIIESGNRVVIVHGNGPQVGYILLRSEYARKILFNNTDLHMNTANKSEKSYKARPILAF